MQIMLSNVAIELVYPRHGQGYKLDLFMIMIFNSTKLVKLMKNDNFHRKKKSSDYLVKLRSPWKNQA